MSDNNVQTANGTSTVWQIIGRLIAAAVILAITAFFTPGFQINNFELKTYNGLFILQIFKSILKKRLGIEFQILL